MHDIIKKALDEALTEKYYAELMGCEDTDYAFSGGFLSEMKALIRRTDNKLLYYSRYIAAAACAVVAIGCAVLLPVLTGDRVEVTDPSVTTSVITTATDEVAVSENTTTPEQTSAPAVSDAAAGTTTITYETAQDTSDDDVDSDTDDSPTSPSADSTTTVPDSTDVSEDSAAPVVSADSEEAADDADADSEAADEEIQGNVTGDENPHNQSGIKDEEAEDVETEESADEEPADDAVENEAEADDDTDVGTDYDTEADDDWVDDGDIWGDDAIIDGDDTIIDGDDAVIEDDSDEDIAEDEEDDVVIEDDSDDDENPGAGGGTDFEDLPIIPGNTMREVIQNAVNGAVFDKLHISYIDINNVDLINGVSMYRFDTNILSYEYIREYILSCGDMAPVYPDSYLELLNGEVMSVFLSVVDESYRLPVYDGSFRNRYEEYFGGVPEDDIDEEDAEPLDSGDRIFFEICEDGGIIMSGYDGRSAYFKVDSAKAEELFAKIRQMNITETAATVGNVIDSAEINADNISEGTARIKSLYDITLSNVPVDSAAAKKVVADFFEKYRNAPVRKLSDVPYSSSVMKNGLQIRFGLNSTSAIMKLIIDSENRAVVSDGRIAYAFDITIDDIKLLMSCICQWVGVPEPVFYETLADYLVDKYYNCLTYVFYSESNGANGTSYHISTAAKLSAVYNMVLIESENLKYDPFESDTISVLQLTTENYGISFTKDGYLRMGQSSFKGTGKLYNDIISYVRANSDITGNSDDEDVTDDEEIMDDFEIEDDVVIEEDIDE